MIFEIDEKMVFLPFLDLFISAEMDFLTKLILLLFHKLCAEVGKLLNCSYDFPISVYN
jgi:hypothetical protein